MRQPTSRYIALLLTSGVCPTVVESDFKSFACCLGEALSHCSALRTGAAHHLIHPRAIGATSLKRDANAEVSHTNIKLYSQRNVSF
jgi:hypothetical protein